MNYDTIWNESDLLLRNKLLQDRVDAFESGEKYVRMQEIHRKAREADLRLIKNWSANVQTHTGRLSE